MMNTELQRLVKGLIDSDQCYICGTRLFIEPSELESDGGGQYRTNYTCSDCETEFKIVVTDEGESLRLVCRRVVDDQLSEEPTPSFLRRQKTRLWRQTHPVKELIDKYKNLNAALTLLWQNRERVTDARDDLEKDNDPLRKNNDFHRRIHADIQNYVASAYTFDEILDNVEPILPTDGPVEEAIDRYDQEKRIIIGLRIYAQHQFTIPFKRTTLSKEDGRTTTITIDLDEVASIESDVSKNNPDGYGYGFDHHYGHVDGGYIEFPHRVDQHYEAAKNVVRAISVNIENIHGDEVEMYNSPPDHINQNSET